MLTPIAQKSTTYKEVQEDGRVWMETARWVCEQSNNLNEVSPPASRTAVISAAKMRVNLRRRMEGTQGTRLSKSRAECRKVGVY